MFQMCGVFAEFERAMVQERVQAGAKRARERGTKSGRPMGRPRGGDIRIRVVTPYGIVDYALTEAGRVKNESGKDARTQGLYIKHVAASELADESIAAIVARNPDDVARSMYALVEDLNTEYLRVTYSCEGRTSAECGC